MVLFLHLDTKRVMRGNNRKQNIVAVAAVMMAWWWLSGFLAWTLHKAHSSYSSSLGFLSALKVLSYEPSSPSLSAGRLVNNNL